MPSKRPQGITKVTFCQVTQPLTRIVFWLALYFIPTTLPFASRELDFYDLTADSRLLSIDNGVIDLPVAQVLWYTILRRG